MADQVSHRVRLSRHFWLLAGLVALVVVALLAVLIGPRLMAPSAPRLVVGQVSFDGPVVGASVRLVDMSGGDVATTVTDEFGDFEFELAGLPGRFRVESAGGTVVGVAVPSNLAARVELADDDPVWVDVGRASTMLDDYLAAHPDQTPGQAETALHADLLRDLDLSLRDLGLSTADVSGAADLSLADLADLNTALPAPDDGAGGPLGRVINGCDLSASPVRCPGANLSGKFLVGASLQGADLSGANLSGAILYDAHLGKANLTGANLYNANLLGANLTNANLTNVDLRTAYMVLADLRGASLNSASLNSASLGSATLTGASLNSANLSGATLGSANLSGASLKSANLSGANLSSANLGDTSYLHGANLEGANLTGAKLNSANLRGANLSGANLDGAHLISATLTGADLTRATLTGASLNSANLSANKYLRGARLNGANLTRADLRLANLRDANLDGANLRGALVTNAQLNLAFMCATTLPDGQRADPGCGRVW